MKKIIAALTMCFIMCAGVICEDNPVKLSGMAMEQFTETIDADTILVMLFDKHLVVYSEENKPDEFYDEFIKQYENNFEKWNESADEHPENQYRRGVYWFVKGINRKAGSSVCFENALNFLRQAQEAKVGKNLIMPLDEMIKVSSMEPAERQEYINKLSTR